MAHQERREWSQTLINPHTADSSGSHLPTPGLRSSHLGFELHLPERAGSEPSRMAASQTTGTVAPSCIATLCPHIHSHAWMWGYKLFPPSLWKEGLGKSGGSFNPAKQPCSSPGSLCRDSRGEGARLVPRDWRRAEGTRQGSHAPKTIRKVPGVKVYLVQ